MSINKTSHVCDLPWCGFDGTNEVDHWQPGTYIPGRLSVTHIESPGSGASVPAVGVGALTIDSTPAVYVHIDGESQDAQADLTLADARRLRDQLDEAIRNAAQAGNWQPRFFRDSSVDALEEAQA